MRIYFDSNALICAVEADDPSQTMLRTILRGAGVTAQIVTSELTLAEIIVGPLSALQDDEDDDAASCFLHVYNSMFDQDSALETFTLSKPLLVRAARLRARRLSLKLPDAMHLATAIEAECSVFLTDDRKLRAAAGPEALRTCSLQPEDLRVLVSEIEAAS